VPARANSRLSHGLCGAAGLQRGRPGVL